MTHDAISLVTVVFEAEVPLLSLQARSVALFCRPDLFREIIVIDNSRSGLSDTAKKRLLRAYGPTSHLIRWLRPSDIATLPPTDGWYAQQVLKLAVSRMIEGDAYIVLDAKDHFIAAPAVHDFIEPDGRARVPFHGYETHPLRSHLERVLEYLSMPLHPHLAHFAATVTPFTFQTDQVREMIGEVGARREPPDFVHEFIDSGLLEFFLYSAWLIRRRGSAEAAFSARHGQTPKIWRSTSSLADVRAAIGSAAHASPPLFSVHRRALATMPLAAVRDLTSFWAGLGLFDHKLQGARFVARFRLLYYSSEIPRKLRQWRRSTGRRKRTS